MIICSGEYAQQWPDVILMPVTSQVRPQRALGEVWLREWAEAGLLKPSAVKPVIATLEQTLILRRLGVLGASDRDSLRAALGVILEAGWSPPLP